MRHRQHGELICRLTFGGPPQMRHKHHLGSGLYGMFDGGYGSADTLVTCDLSILDWNVEILAYEQSFAG